MLTGRLGCIGFLNTLVALYVRHIKSGWVKSNYLLDTRCPCAEELFVCFSSVVIVSVVPDEGFIL